MQREGEEGVREGITMQKDSYRGLMIMYLTHLLRAAGGGRRKARRGGRSVKGR